MPLAIFFGFGAAGCLLLALIVLALGWRAPDPDRVVAKLVGAAAFSGLLAGLAWANEYLWWSGVELNPTCQASELAGEWSLGADRLVLAPDGGATLPDGGPGKWKLGEAASLDVSGGSWAVIRRYGRLQLLRAPPDDPDMWNLGRVYTRPGDPRP